MNTIVLSVVGVAVAGLPLADVDARKAAELRRLLGEHGVLILPGQDVDDAGFVAFLKRFGELAFTKGETPVAGFPDLNVVSNVGRSTPPRSVFHVDTSYVRRPPAYTALRAVTIPARGGETLFTNQYRAYDDPAAPMLRATLAGPDHPARGDGPGPRARTTRPRRSTRSSAATRSPAGPACISPPRNAASPSAGWADARGPGHDRVPLRALDRPRPTPTGTSGRRATW